jgi:uncharacterized protein (DUF305 family)
MKTVLPAAVLSILLLAAPAPAQDKEAAEAAATPETLLGMMTMKPGAEMSEADRGYMKSMQSMQQSMMKTEMTGDPSGDFARMMIPHHQSAVDMVDVLLAQADVDPAIRKMAEKMKADQVKEIAEMKEWLDKHQT